MTDSEPQEILAEEPQGAVPGVPRPAFGFREVAILTVVVMVAATLLVFLLYMSPLAAR